MSRICLLIVRPPKLSPARFVTCFPLVGSHQNLFYLHSFPISLTLLCCPFSEQARIPLMLLHCLLPRLLTFLLYYILTVGLVIFILPRLWSHGSFHIWTMKHYPTPTSSPHTIYTTRIQILLLLAPLDHNPINVIRTKWWSSSSILYFAFVSCSWTCPFNHSWCLIHNPSSSYLCKMPQQYFHCEWTISSIPTTIPTDQPSAVLWDYLSARFYSWMLCHALTTHPSIILSHPISSCAIDAPMIFYGRIS